MYNDVLDILFILEVQLQVGGNSIFLLATLEIADRIIKNNWTMSFDGPITFTSNDYDPSYQTYSYIENIMCETDAPFAAPTPYRSQLHYPQYVEHIYKRIAEIKEITLEDFKNQMFINVNNFNILIYSILKNIMLHTHRNETTYFGPATLAAVIKYQKAKKHYSIC